ncbi:uncharacterized protein HMPREF1541_03136 [Cyphellophora europaea CBS 101466]|uniref:Methyltransferase type 11 domain-containing protein n=1 Tax=Cyphellophora europaea (strain CBS 101466) TaxID=1220924 RepID=W2RXF2_CYPE1|nr:uncharacterized protein HMPREF1541_03136 [Cyphellophora europaea CBS 101466]ETN41201.1 hypothetical protein HMPREF1541_03136 [Cyphellophora europaea CBS 101466]
MAPHLYGADLKPELIALGDELFRDASLLPRATQFIAPADVLDGRVKFVHATAVFHLFEWTAQDRVAGRVARLLRRRRRWGAAGGRKGRAE